MGDLGEERAGVALAHVALLHEDGAEVEGLRHPLLDRHALPDLILGGEPAGDGDLAEVDLCLRNRHPTRLPKVA
jgi:hypothetical protein